MICFFIFSAQDVVASVPYTLSLYASKCSEMRFQGAIRYLMCLQTPEKPMPEYAVYLFDTKGSSWTKYTHKMILMLNEANAQNELLLKFWSFALNHGPIDDTTKKYSWFVSPCLVHNKELCEKFPDLAQDWCFAYALLSRKNPHLIWDLLNERKKSGRYIYPEYLYVLYQAHREHLDSSECAGFIQKFLTENSELIIHRPDFPALLKSQFYTVRDPYSCVCIKKFSYAGACV